MPQIQRPNPKLHQTRHLPSRHTLPLPTTNILVQRTTPQKNLPHGRITDLQFLPTNTPLDPPPRREMTMRHPNHIQIKLMVIITHTHTHNTHSSAITWHTQQIPLNQNGIQDELRCAGIVSTTPSQCFLGRGFRAEGEAGLEGGGGVYCGFPWVADLAG